MNNCSFFFSYSTSWCSCYARLALNHIYAILRCRIDIITTAANIKIFSNIESITVVPNHNTLFSRMHLSFLTLCTLLFPLDRIFHCFFLNAIIKNNQFGFNPRSFFFFFNPTCFRIVCLYFSVFPQVNIKHLFRRKNAGRMLTKTFSSTLFSIFFANKFSFRRKPIYLPPPIDFADLYSLSIYNSLIWKTLTQIFALYQHAI